MEFLFHGIWQFGPFLSQKFLYIGWNNIFEVEIWQKSTNKKINVCGFILHLCSFHIDIFNLYHLFYLCIYSHIIECWSRVYLVCLLRFMVVSCENSTRILSPHMEFQCHLSPCEVVSLVSYAPKARTRNFKNGVYFP